MGFKGKLQQLLVYKNDNIFVQFLRSVFVGGLATLVDWAVFYILAIMIRMHPIVAGTVSFTFGLVINFYFTQAWVFSYKPANQTKSFTNFAVIGVVGLILNSLLLLIMIDYHILVDYLKIADEDTVKMLAKVIATFIVFVWNFSARKYFIFRETQAKSEKTGSATIGSIKAFYQRNRNLILVLTILVIGYYFLYQVVKVDILAHDDHDSYTTQALMWWQGRADLGQDYPWFELATYKHKIYVSFPPVPSVAMFLLVPFFGGNTPDILLDTLYALFAFIMVYKFCKRQAVSDTTALFWALFLVIGGNLVELSVSGSVWFQAQVTCFVLTVASLYLITSGKKSHWHLGLLCWALSIGCRPYQAFYFPIYLYILAENLKQRNEIASVKDLFKFFSYAILPLLVFIAYGWYNWIRFENPLEFGHNYLPEFMRAQYGQFSFNYIKDNLPNIFRWPGFISGTTRFTTPRFDGFMFFIANPIFIPFFVRLVRGIVRREIAFYDIVIPVLILIHIIGLLMHRTLGGWQFGVRYFVDFLPFVFLYIFYKQPKFYRYEIVLLAFGIMLNVYGTAWLYLDWK